MFGNNRQRQKVVERWIAARNSRDFSAIELLIADHCQLIDSRGDSIVGREDCLEAMRRFFALDPGFTLHVESIITNADETLVKGRTTAADPRLALDTLWRARSTTTHLVEWQSYSAKPSPAVLHILMGSRAHPPAI